MIVTHREMTKRRFGSKLPFKVVRKFRNEQGITTVECEADFWIGPLYAGSQGFYERVRWVESAGRKDAEGVFHLRRPSSCSYESELAKALK